MDIRSNRLVSFTQPGSFAAEQYQNLRLKIERMRQTRDLRVIAVTSPAAHDGKTLTAINLAGALARGAASRVLLVDADLRRPEVAKQLNIEAEPGLGDLIGSEQIATTRAITSLDAYNVDVIPAGTVPGPAHDSFRSLKLVELLHSLRQRYGYIVLDTPPLAPVVDSSLIARLADGVLLVVSADRTPRRLVEDALNEIDAAKVLGIVFNNDARPLHGHDSAYRRYFTPAH